MTGPCCCGESRCADPAPKRSDAPPAEVPRLSTEWSWRDRLDHVRCRLGSFRSRYQRPPGLHAVGAPGRDAEVLVTANYGLTVDVVRRALRGVDAWLLVLDTRGVNVWCAAGKGTFGTAELIARIREAALDRVVDHRRVIVPQLGAPGVSAHEVQAATGFRVHYGPVRADDLPAWLRAGRVASPAMRRVRFGLLDRAVLVPMELNPALRKLLAASAVLFVALLAFGFGPAAAWHRAAPVLALALTAVVAGAVVAPLALPLLPGRSFSVKGLAVGAPAAAGAFALLGPPPAQAPLLALGALLAATAVSSYLALQFTGATTFTGISGVRREMRFAVPAQLAAAAIGLVALAAHALVGRGTP